MPWPGLPQRRSSAPAPLPSSTWPDAPSDSAPACFPCRLNYLPASHVPWCVEQVRRGGDATIYAKVHVGVGDRAAAAPQGRSFTRAGFGRAVQAIRAAHQAGDRAGALAAVSDEMVDAIDVVGDQALVTRTISAYRKVGVEVPVVYPLVWGAPGQEALEPTLQAALASAASDTSA